MQSLSTRTTTRAPGTEVDLTGSAGPLLAVVQAEVTQLWNAALVGGDSQETERFAAVSHMLLRARRMLDDKPSIG